MDIYADTNPLYRYACSTATKSKGFTKLMKWVLLTKEYPEILEEIEKLIKSNSEILNKQNAKGWTALMLACRNTNTWSSELTVKILINAGANLNLQEEDGYTSLMFAVSNSGRDSSEFTVQMLINAKADINLVDSAGWTPLMSASRNSKKKEYNKYSSDVDMCGCRIKRFR